MKSSRVEAFSDGVLAIIITIMVLEFKVPHDSHLSALRPIVPVFISYVLSFVHVGIYWNNHHHMLHVTQRVNGRILWANMHLLFWLSLIPFVTAWMGENHFAAIPTAAYGIVLLLSAIAYWLLQRAILSNEGEGSVLSQAVGSDRKGRLSPLIYIAGVLATLIHPWISLALYAAVALIWLIPDPRIERVVARHQA